MRFVEGIDKIVISDNVFNMLPFNSGDIEIGISKNSRTYYENIENIAQKKEESIYFLENYTGKIIVPPFVGIVITTSRNISGITASPLAISGGGDLKLEIDEKSDLGLCLATDGPTIINGKVLDYGQDMFGEEHSYFYGMDIDYFRRKYVDIYGSNNTVKIIEDKKCISAKFEGNNKDFSMIDICMYYNLAFINKERGVSKINYTPPEINIPEYNLLLRTKNNLRRLSREKELLLQKKDYSKLEYLSSIAKKIRSAEQDISEIQERISKKKITQNQIQKSESLTEFLKKI